MREAEQRETGRRRPQLDAQQFAALFEQAWPTLWTISAAVLGRRSDVEDVLQESAVIALGKLEQFDPETSFTAWMGQIVRFTALNSGRRRQRLRAHTTSANGLLEQAIDEQSQASHRRADQVDPGAIHPDQLGFDDQLLASMMKLSEPQRVCLLLRVVHDHPYREIARVMDIPEGTAMSHVHRAQKTLRQMLSDTDTEVGEGERTTHE